MTVEDARKLNKRYAKLSDEQIQEALDRAEAIEPSPRPDIKAFRQATGMTQQQFADYFGLSVRTLQDWEQERRTPPVYVLEMMKRIWTLERKEN